MLWKPLLLLPLALARPHHPDTIAHRRQALARAQGQLVERAGAAYDNETRAEISAWEHDHNSATVSSAVDSAMQSSAVESASASAIQAVGTALTAVNTPSPSASSAAPTSAQEESAAAQPSPDVVSTSEESFSEPASSAAPVAAIASPSPSAEESSASVAPSSVTRTTVVTASRSSTVVQVTASSSASAASAKTDSGDEKIAGINKTTFIIIIVVAALVALAGVGWTVFRKWKLSPSRKFDDKMRPIDFSPHNDAFLEKSHHRSSSNSSAAMQRDEFIAELDNKHVAGVPDHDFTAGGGMAGQGAYQDYNSDPYAHAEAYEYDPTYPYDQPQHPHQNQAGYDQPTQDTGAGYAELQRGNSIGSGSGHGHGQQYAVEQFTMPMPDQYLGRPTGGSDGPYSQAAQHRY